MRYDRLSPLDVPAPTDRTVAVVGLGATGSHIAAFLARIGVDLRIIDRDVLEPQNLATSALYTDTDVGRAKAAAAADRLNAVTPDITVDRHVAAVDAMTASDLLDGADLLMDGTDNVRTRQLLNAYAVKTETPWIHVAALGYQGQVLPVIPGETPCFRCVFGAVDGSLLGTCETSGILPQAAATAASTATTAAVQVLDGDTPAGLTRFNLRQGTMDTYAVERQDDCPICQGQEFAPLETDGPVTTAVCGTDQFHVNPHREQPLDLDRQQEQLAEQGEVTRHGAVLRFDGADTVFSVFRDGRAIITADTEEQAEAVYDRYIGR